MCAQDDIMGELDIESHEQLVDMGKRPRHNFDPLPRFSISDSADANPSNLINPDLIGSHVDLY